MPIRFAHRPGLVVYLTVGDPDLATTRAVALAAIDAGADVLELGVPFSDPLADGPVIERASQRAVANGTTLADVLALAKELRTARPQTGLVIFSYLNPILRYGLERFTTDAKAAGVDGVLATDLTIEEAEGRYLDAMRAAGLAPIFLAAPTSTDDRLRASRLFSQGFVYAISRVGITGTQQTLATDARESSRAPAPLHEAAHRARLRRLQRNPCRRARRIRRCRRRRQRHRGTDREDPTERCARGSGTIH